MDNVYLFIFTLFVPMSLKKAHFLHLYVAIMTCFAMKVVLANHLHLYVAIVTCFAMKVVFANHLHLNVALPFAILNQRADYKGNHIAIYVMHCHEHIYFIATFLIGQISSIFLFLFPLNMLPKVALLPVNIFPSPVPLQLSGKRNSNA